MQAFFCFSSFFISAASSHGAQQQHWFMDITCISYKLIKFEVECKLKHSTSLKWMMCYNWVSFFCIREHLIFFLNQLLYWTSEINCQLNNNRNLKIWTMNIHCKYSLYSIMFTTLNQNYYAIIKLRVSTTDVRPVSSTKKKNSFIKLMSIKFPFFQKNKK